VDCRVVRRACDDPVEGVNLPDKVALAEAADRWIA
jgi:hypothetical protein